MSPEVITDLKKFNWQTIIDFGMSLDDLNDRQWRFIKGLVAELAVEQNAVNGLVYVGEDHKDYDWPHHGLTVELKSQLSGPMYLKKFIPGTQTRQMVKKIAIKLNNSHGTNKKSELPPEHVADLLIVVRNDGAFALTKDTVLQRAKHGGDGFEVLLDRDLDAGKIIELSGYIQQKNHYDTNLKEKLIETIRNSIPKNG